MQTVDADAKYLRSACVDIWELWHWCDIQTVERIWLVASIVVVGLTTRVNPSNTVGLIPNITLLSISLVLVCLDELV